MIWKSFSFPFIQFKKQPNISGIRVVFLRSKTVEGKSLVLYFVLFLMSLARSGTYFVKVTHLWQVLDLSSCYRQNPWVVKDLFIGVSDCRTKKWHELHRTMDSSVFTLLFSSTVTTAGKYLYHFLVRGGVMFLPSCIEMQFWYLVLLYIKLLVTYSYNCITSDITMTTPDCICTSWRLLFNVCVVICNVCCFHLHNCTVIKIAW